MGFYFSPVTGLRRIQVQGADPEQYRIQQALEPFKQVPWPQQNRNRMVSAILAHPGIERAEVTANPMGRAFVSITPRTPVAYDTDRKVALSSEGVLYPLESGDDLPAMKLPSSAYSPHLAMASQWSLKNTARVAQFAHDLFREQPVTLVLDDRSVLSFLVASGPRIILGTDTQLEQKFTVVKNAVESHPESINRVKVINVSAPNRPVVSTS